MKRHLSTSIVCGLAVVATLGLAGTASAQSTDSTARPTSSTARVTSSRRIPVRKDAVNNESAGSIAPTPNADSTARADSMARADSIANADRMRQDSIANAERMRQDSIASAERMRQDSIANAERMRQDSIARADSITRWNLAHMRRPGSGLYFQIAGGASMPQSDFKDGFDRGWNATGSVGFHPFTSPIGVRFDAAYDRFGAKNAVAGSDDNVSVWSGLADITLRVPRMWAVSPYLIGGGGFSHFSAYNGTDSQTKGQWNAGAGIGFGLGNVKLFVESRYMHVATPGTATKFVPVILGISL
jgi:opacity protein-like surface antigen